MNSPFILYQSLFQVKQTSKKSEKKGKKVKEKTGKMTNFRLKMVLKFFVTKVQYSCYSKKYVKKLN